VWVAVCVVVRCGVLQCVYHDDIHRQCVLQCVAVCCSVLQYVAVCCSVLQCSELQYVYHADIRCQVVLHCVLQYVLQCVAVCVAVSCSAYTTMIYIASPNVRDCIINLYQSHSN